MTPAAVVAAAPVPLAVALEGGDLALFGGADATEAASGWLTCPCPACVGVRARVRLAKWRAARAVVSRVGVALVPGGAPCR